MVVVDDKILVVNDSPILKNIAFKIEENKIIIKDKSNVKVSFTHVFELTK